MIDTKAFGEELAGIVKAATMPLLSRIDALEKALAERPLPQNGKDADPAEVAAIVADHMKGQIVELREMVAAIPSELPDVAAMVRESVNSAVAEIPAPKDGESVDPEVVRRMVAEAVSAIPAPQNGKNADPAEVQRMVDEAVSAIPPAKDGKDADPEMVRAMVDEAVAAIPLAKDGESVAIEDVLPALERRVDEHLARIPAPKDGDPGKSVTADDVLPALIKHADDYLAALNPVGLAGALIDRDGNLVVTLSNGEAKALGPVVGKDGVGRDGLGFDDMDLEYDGERTLTFLFEKGDRRIERKFTVPVVLDRGVYRPEQHYTKGDAVTYGGSVWIAQHDTTARPDQGGDWRLSVKAGRNGRDGVMKPAEDRGPVRVGGGHAD